MLDVSASRSCDAVFHSISAILHSHQQCMNDYIKKLFHLYITAGNLNWNR